MIAPHFQRLANQHSAPKKVAFAKVNVDSQQEVAQQYQVSAMPTFKIFHNGTCIETLQGANPTGLSEAVAKAVKLAGAGRAAAGFKTPGRTLGGETRSRGPGFSLNKLINVLITFVGLYFVSLLSVRNPREDVTTHKETVADLMLLQFDAQKAAEQSRFNVHNTQRRAPAAPRASPAASGSASGSASKAAGGASRPQQRSAFKTLADL